MKKSFLIISILINSIYSHGQVDNLGHLSNTLWYVGWNNLSTDPLNIRHDAQLPINFYTNSAFRMTIHGSTGFVGIGTTNPTRRLNVVDDIDLTPGTFPNSGYRWQDTVIIRTNDVMTNIYYGRGAGKFVSGSSSSNTYLGVESGKKNASSGGGNTFIGYSSGMSGINDESVFVGSTAGENNAGNNNSFVGVSSGSNSVGSENSFFGHSA